MGEDEVPRETRDEVATAVRKAIAKHGYARLTTKQIAAETEMSEAGLYYHYDTKDELIVTFLEAASDHLSEELADVEASDPETALRAALEHLFTHHDDEEARGVDVAMMELLSHAPSNETLRAPLLTMVSNTIDHLESVVEAGVEDGTFRPVDTRGTATFLLAAAHGSTGFYLALGMTEAGSDLHEQVDAYVDSLLADRSD